MSKALGRERPGQSKSLSSGRREADNPVEYDSAKVLLRPLLIVVVGVAVIVMIKLIVV